MKPKRWVSIVFSLLLIALPAAGQQHSAIPANPHASPEARALLNYLYSISGHYTLSGQHNYPNHIARWTDRVYDLTGKYPALFGEDFGFSGGEDKDSVEARTALIAEVEGQYRNGAVVTSKTFWWGGRKGLDGSAALYRQLFDRMVFHNGLHKLIWVWTAAVPDFGPNGNGPLADFFPGLLYVDALSVEEDNLNPRWRMDAALGVFGVGKVIGVELAKVPSPDPPLNQKWAWFLISPDDAGSPERSQTLQLLYKDPRVLERAESETHASAK